MPKKKLETAWEAWTYDVWGNAKDGYEVNDRRCVNRDLRLSLSRVTHNKGTPNQFESATPSDAQLRAAFNIGKTRITVDGDDTTIYVTRSRDDYPIGELFLTSHKSLSPIPPTSDSLEYRVDLDERGSYRAAVFDPMADEDVYTIRAGNELEEGDTSIFEDGFMRNDQDMKGLTDYLRGLGVIAKTAEVHRI